MIRLLLSIFLFTSAFLQAQDNRLRNETRPQKTIVPEPCKLHLRFGGSYCLRYTPNLKDAYRSYYSQTKPFKVFGNYHERTSAPFYASISYQLHERWSLGYVFLPLNQINYQGKRGDDNWVVVFIIPISEFIGKKVHEQSNSHSHLFNFQYTISTKRTKKRYFQLYASGGPMINFHSTTTNLTASDTVNQRHIEGNMSFKERGITIGAMGNFELEFRTSSRLSFFAQLNAGYSSRYKISSKSFTVGQQTAEVPEHFQRLAGVGFSLGMGFHFLEQADR